MSTVLNVLEEILEEHYAVVDVIYEYLDEANESFYYFFSKDGYRKDFKFKELLNTHGAELVGNGGIGVVLKLNKYDDVCLKVSQVDCEIQSPERELNMTVTPIGYSKFSNDLFKEYCTKEGLIGISDNLTKSDYTSFFEKLSKVNHEIAHQYVNGPVDKFHSLPKHLKDMFIDTYFVNHDGSLKLIEYRSDLLHLFDHTEDLTATLNDEVALAKYLEIYKELHTLGFFFSDLHTSNIAVSKETGLPIFFDLDCFYYAEGLKTLNSENCYRYHNILRATHSFILNYETGKYESLLLELHKPNK